MDNLERQQKQKKFDEVKHTLRKFEGLLEIGILTVIYYLFWRNCYDIPTMHDILWQWKIFADSCLCIPDICFVFLW